MALMNLSGVVSRFATPLPVEVYDVAGEYVSGEWVWGEPVLRVKNLKAVVLQLSIEQLQMYQEGNISDGGIALLTSEPMCVSGVHQEYDTGVQSFVMYQGQKWRVVGDGFLSGPDNVGNTTTHCWHCLRWFK